MNPPQMNPSFGSNGFLNMLTPFMNSFMGGQGMVPGQFNPSQNYFDRIRGGNYSAGLNQVMTDASKHDQKAYIEMMQGMANLAGRPFGDAERKQAEAASKDLAKLGPMMAQIAPKTFDAFHGSRGSAQVMGAQVFDASRFIRDPHSGQMGLAANQASWLNQQLYTGLFGKDDDVKKMNGLGAGQAGQMFNEMTKRGMAGGQDTFTDGGMDRLKDKMRKMSGAVRAMQDIFGESGRQDAPMQEIFAALDKITQGGLATMTPGQVNGITRRVQALSHLTGTSIDTMAAMSDRGGAMAESVGLNRQFGVSTSMSSAAFGSSFGAMAGPQGFGGLSKDQAIGLDQKLRTSAANSSMANMLGATAKLAEAGLLKGNPAFTSEDPKVRESAVQNLLGQVQNMNPQQWRQFMQDQGVSAGVASNFLSSKDANQDAVFRYGAQDRVREAQGKDAFKFMANAAGAGASQALRSSGVDNRKAADASKIIGPAIADALGKMSPELLSDPAKTTERNKLLKASVQNALRSSGISLTDQVLDQVIANAVQTLDQRVRSDPRTKQFGNISGLISMNRGDIHQQTRQNLLSADKAAELASISGGIGQQDVIRRIADAVMGAKPGDDLAGVAGRALGGIPADQIRRILGPDADKILKQMVGGSAGKDDKAAPGSPAPAKKTSSDGPSPTSDMKKTSSSGGREPMEISGELTIIDNRGKMSGSGRPGNVMEPA